LYEYQTRETIVNMIKREIPPSKLNGAVLFFNGQKQSLELFLPSKGEFRSLTGELLDKTEPITKTFETEVRYYFDKKTGEVRSYEIEKKKAEYMIREGIVFDELTGKFRKEETGEEVPKEEAVVSIEESSS